MKVLIHYKGDTGGGMLTLTEDASSLPRLPEVGETITIDQIAAGLEKTYEVLSVDWVVKKSFTRIGFAVTEVTLNIRCQGV